MPENNDTAAVACIRVKLKSSTSALLSVIFLASSATYGASFEFDNVTVDLDSTITYGIQWRAEDRDDRISLGSLGSAEAQDLFNLVDMIDNAYVLNANDGNLNADKGDIVANRISYLGDIDFNFGSFGVFTRVKAWYDYTWDKNDTSMSNEGYLSYNPNPRFMGKWTAEEGEYNPESRNYMAAKARFLDFFVYGGLDIGDSYLDLRVGRQVINWGESMLSGGGIAMSTNHLDTQIRNTPGLEVKEMFLPTGAIFAQFDIAGTINFQAYYQYEWNKSILDPSSSFYSEFDSLGQGSETFIFVSGEEEYVFDHDFNADFLGDPDHPLQKYLPRDGCSQGTQVGQGYEGRETCDYLVAHKYSDTDARDSGQFGLSFQLAMEDGSEIGFYYINYHEKLPTFTLELNVIDKFAPMIEFLMEVEPDKVYNNPEDRPDQCENFTFSGPESFGGCMSTAELDLLLAFLGALPFNGGTIDETMTNMGEYQLSNGLTMDFGSDAIKTLANTVLATEDESTQSFVTPVNYRIDYMEDIHLWGVSYSTVIGNANVAGEISYRENAPILRGDIVRTTDREEVWHAHINSIMIFEPTALWDSATLVAEVVGWHIPGRTNFNESDMADFEASENRLAVQNTANGSGISFSFMPEYRSIFSGIDLVVTFYTSYGIDGAMFTTGYKNHQGTTALGLTMKFLGSLEAGISYVTMYGEKDDIFQTMTQDRDNYSFNMKYSF